MIKFDKEAMRRQRFWYCEGAFVLIWLIGMLSIWGTSPESEAASKKYTSTVGSVRSTVNPKNAAFCKPWNDAKVEFQKRKAVVHKDAWDLQKEQFTWPSSNLAPLQEIWVSAESWPDWYNKFSDEKISGDYRLAFKESLFLKQFTSLYNNINGTGVENLAAEKLETILDPVEFKGGLDGFRTMMAPTVAGGGPAGNEKKVRKIDAFFKGVPTVEECWYAQEDFWLKGEVLQAVRRTLDAAGQFNREPKGFWAAAAYRVEHADCLFGPYAAPAPADSGRKYIAEHRFRNGSWEMHLVFEREDKEGGKIYVSGNSTIRNADSGRRVQAGTRPPGPNEKVRRPLVFRLVQPAADGGKTSRAFQLEVRARDMAWDQVERLQTPVELVNPKDEPVIDPSKPFDLMQLCDWPTAPIRRIDDIKTCYHSHRDAHVQLKPHPFLYKPLPPLAAATTPGAPPAAPLPPELPKPTDNNLERNRYLNVTDTTRDIPFAVVVVLEPLHLGDFLAQLANSRLRIQVTQVDLKRVRNVAPNPKPADKGPAPPNQVFDRVHGSGNPAAAVNPASTANVNDPNLVEVTVYGIAAMYEKFSTKTK